MEKIRREIIEQELTTASKEFLLKSYGIDLIIPIKVNKRLKTTLGRFRHYRNTNKPVDIELSGRLLEYGTIEQILSTLKHECIHYALYMLNKPYKDGQATFENELKKHNANSTGTQRLVDKRYIYACGCREYESYTNRYSKNYYCRTCDNQLRLKYIDEPTPIRKIV